MATSHNITDPRPLTWAEIKRDYLSAGFYTINPALAENILESRNPLNRKMSQIKLAQTCADIEAGRFLVNGESVIFDSEGNLLDGQHRLTACVKTGIPIVSLCAFGIDPIARSTVDLGKARGPGDIAAIRGVPDGNNVAAIARMVIAYQTGDGSSLGRPGSISAACINEFIDHHPDIVAVNQWAARYTKTLIGIFPRTVLGAARMILEPVYGPRVIEYLEQLGGGENISSGDPAFAVRKRFWGGRVANGAALEGIFRGAMAFMDGRTLSRVEINNRFPAMR